VTKTEKQPVWSRVARAARIRSARERGLYVAARRLLAPRRAIVRTLTARRAGAGASFEIPRDRGFALFPPAQFAEAREVADAASEQLRSIDPSSMEREGKKPFMLPILDQGSLTADSPFVRFALRDDVVRAVTSYLGVTPILSSINVYYSRSVERELISSQLFHLDGDDTRQIKVFILSTAVDEASGPLMIMDAQTSERLRRELGYKFKSRVDDEEATATLGSLDLTAVVGEPGTTCFVDTSRCFHYGSRVESDALPRLVTIVQYLTPYSFMLPRDYREGAPYRHLATEQSGQLEQLVLGAR
jgi:hypothetical protein